MERWRPFFEVLHKSLSHQPSLLAWISLLCSSDFIHVCFSLKGYKPTVSLYITTAACIVILILAFVSPNGVYKHWPLNVLEFSFPVNLSVLSTLVATFCHSSGPHASSFVYPSVAIAMVPFACIVLCHCMKRLMSYNCFRIFIQSVATRKAKFCSLKRFDIWK